MRKILAAAMIPVAFSMTPAYAQERYSISALHTILHEKGDEAYVSANGYFYYAEFHPHKKPDRRVLRVIGVKKERYPNLNVQAVDDQALKNIFDGLMRTNGDSDVIAVCTGTVFGDKSHGYPEYFSLLNDDVLTEEHIRPGYKDAFAKIVNDIATAIVKSRK